MSKINKLVRSTNFSTFFNIHNFFNFSLVICVFPSLFLSACLTGVDRLECVTGSGSRSWGCTRSNSSEVRGPSWALKHLRHSSSVRDVDQSASTQGQQRSEQQSSRTQFHLKNHHTISFTWHNRAILGMLKLFGNRFVVLCLCHVGLIFRGDLVCESKFKPCFNRAVIYGRSCSSLHLSLGSWTFTRTILFKGISFFGGTADCSWPTALTLALHNTAVSCLTYLPEVCVDTYLLSYLNEYIPLLTCNDFI